MPAALPRHPFATRLAISLTFIGLPAAPLAAIEHFPTPELATPAPALDDDSAAFAATLKRIVRPDGIDYAALVADHADLDRYRAQLAVCAMPMDAKAKKALFLNAYHAWTLAILVNLLPADQRRWPTWRIYDQGTPTYSLWRRYDFELAHQRFILDDLDGANLKPMKDPRIRCVLWHASWGSPTLRAEPFVAARLDAQLDAASTAFLVNPSHVLLSPDLKVVTLPNYFGANQDDFHSVGGIPQFIALHGNHPLGIAVGSGATIVFGAVNWRLDWSPTCATAALGANPYGDSPPATTAASATPPADK
jgi:hypothetical protein